jgi:hypothetical protein
MIWLYLLLVIGGVMTTGRAITRKDRGRAAAGVVGTLLAVLAILTGFSIGPIVALASLLVIIFAASGIDRRPASGAGGGAA